MRAALGITFASIMIHACDMSRAEPLVTVEDAWIQVSPVSGRPAAGYFSLKSNHDDIRLVSVSLPIAARIDLHGSNMRPLTAAALTFTDRKLSFQPGDKHLMIHDMAPALKPCEFSSMLFTFDKAPAVRAAVQVRPMGQGQCPPDRGNDPGLEPS